MQYVPDVLAWPSAWFFLALHQAAISWITFGPGAKWGITWQKSGAPASHWMQAPLRAGPEPRTRVFT